jgi:hypothetical protein
VRRDDIGGWTVDADDWLDVAHELPKRYGLWPGGLYCALTVDPENRVKPSALLLEVWTLEGEPVVFVEHYADQRPCCS